MGILANFQFGGCILGLGLLIATIVSHVRVSGKPYTSYEAKELAIFYTSSYTAVVAYGISTVVSVLLETSYRGSICSILYNVFDAIFVICAGGTLVGSQLAAIFNGGGVAMIAFLLFLVAVKIFPMLFIKFNVLESSVNKTSNLRFIGIGAVVLGATATLAYGATVLAIYIRVLYSDDVSDDININLMYLNVPFFFNCMLLASFGCLIFVQDKLIAYTVEVINLFTQIALGYSLNFMIQIPLFAYWKDSDDTVFVFYYNTQIAMTIAVILMIITSICISIFQPFFPTSKEDERKSLLN